MVPANLHHPYKRSQIILGSGPDPSRFGALAAKVSEASKTNVTVRSSKANQRSFRQIPSLPLWSGTDSQALPAEFFDQTNFRRSDAAAWSSTTKSVRLSISARERDPNSDQDPHRIFQRSARPARVRDSGRRWRRD